MAVPESRIEAARRRIRIVRYSILSAAAGAFALFGIAARDAHPATHASGSAAVSTDTATAAATNQDDSFGFGGGASISPSSGSSAPDVQSGGS